MWLLGFVLVLAGGLWFSRRLFPALFAVALVLLAPIWLVGGFLLDQVKRVFIRDRR
jgi:hypothetical protein